MEKMILLLMICFLTYFLSTYWLKKYNRKKIESINNNAKVDFGKLMNVHIKNVKIGSVILIIIIIIKMVYLFFK